MNGFIKYFVRYPIAGNILLILSFIFGGLFCFPQLKTTFFPETPPSIIQISAVYPGASPEEIEKGVILKIEDNLTGITGVERVSSTSKENLGNVLVEILKSHDPSEVYKDVKNAVDRISSFPTDMEPPVISIVENLSPQSVRVGLSGEVDLKELKRFAEIIEDDLRATGFISKITISGYPLEEIEVSVNEDKLKAFDLTISQISGAIASANLEITGGTIKGEKQEISIRAKNKQYYAEDLQGIVVKALPDGSVVRLSDVADVQDRWEDSPSRSWLNGKPAVIINVQNTSKEDLIKISNFVKEYCTKFSNKYAEVNAQVIRDGAVIVQQRKQMLFENGALGLALVLIFLAMFLNIRLAFWVAVGIPFSFFGLFIVGAYTDLTLNVISLFGMILVIGLLVDDGIVIAENIYQKHEKGLPPLRAAMEGTMQVLPAVITAIMTTVLAFSIFFFLDGGIGDFISDMAFVVIVTLLVSLIEAVLILPAHVGHSKALTGNEKPNAFERKTKAIIQWLREKTYAPILRFCLDNKFMTISVPIALFIVTMGAMQGGVITGTFFPNIDFDEFDIVLKMPAGTSRDITETWINEIEGTVWEVNEHFKSEREDVMNVIANLEKSIGPGTHEARLSATLLDGETRSMASFKITNMIREKQGSIPGAESISYGRVSPFGKPIDISLQSHNIEQLESAADQLKEKLSDLGDLKDVIDNNIQGADEINIVLKEKARLLGLTELEILRQIRQGFFGSEVQRLQRGADEVKVWVRYDEAERDNIGKLENMYIRTNQGQFPLRELVNFEMAPGIIEISHLYGKREIRIQADMGNPDGSASDINTFVTDSILPIILDAYPEVSSSMEGQVREQTKMFSSMGGPAAALFLLMLALIAFTFRSGFQMVMVWLLIPFTFVGVAWGHYLWGKPISILSFYGIIALIGILVNDSLVLIASVNANLKDGMPFRDAVYQGALSRFRPIVLTSVTTILGLMPLMLEGSLQAEFLKPMALSVSYGLLFATLLTLILLPTLLICFNYLRRGLYWWWNGEYPAPEKIEPAIREMKYENEEF